MISGPMHAHMHTCTDAHAHMHIHMHMHISTCTCALKGLGNMDVKLFENQLKCNQNQSLGGSGGPSGAMLAPRGPRDPKTQFVDPLGVPKWAFENYVFGAPRDFSLAESLHFQFLG